MNKKILYLGDTRLTEAASYLAGVLAYYGFRYEYHPSDASFENSWAGQDTALVILSDYAAKNFSRQQLERLASAVRKGLSLFMIGGWESFVGLEGGYQQTAIAEVLPVTLLESDDRVNQSCCCMVRQNHKHPVVRDLPFEQNPPSIGGFNRLIAKADSDVVLSAIEYRAFWRESELHFETKCESPLLVLGTNGEGRTAAFASDAAPHWVGPLVDWGDKRLTARAAGSAEIEVGNWYAEFFKNVICWLLNDMS
jgi:uncharacterized membrane protein